MFLARPGLDINAEDMKDGDDPPWHALAKNWELSQLRSLLANENFQPWRPFRPSAHDLHDSYLSYHKNTDYDYPSFGSAMTVVPGIVKVLENDTRFDFSPWYALELLWPFVYYAYSSIPIPTYQKFYPIDWMGIWDTEEGTWRQMLRDHLKSEEISINYRDRRGNGFLHWLCKSEEWDEEGNKTTDMASFLLQSQSVDILGDRGRTPLFVAAEHGRKIMITLLLNAGADVRALDNDGYSVLHFAAKSCDLETFELLANEGADIHATTIHAESVFLFAVDAARESTAIVEYLIARGADPNEGDAFGMTPLHYAVYNTLDIVKLLLQNGADPTRCTKERGTPLHESILLRNVKFPQLLLEYYSGDLNQLEQLDYLGMSVLDYLSEFTPGFGTDCGFAEKHWATYKKASPEVRRRRILECLLERLDLMIAGDEYSRNEMASGRFGFRFLKLGDEEAALTIFNTEALHDSKRGMVYFRDLECAGCYQEDGILFKCKTCPFKWICDKCRTSDRDMTKGFAPQCTGHEFLKVPSDDWRDIPEGKVNVEGQTLLEFLIDMREKYRAIEH